MYITHVFDISSSSKMMHIIALNHSMDVRTVLCIHESMLYNSYIDFLQEIIFEKNNYLTYVIVHLHAYQKLINNMYSSQFNELFYDK